MKQTVFHGACTALVTPFREGYINYCMFDRLLERQLIAGIDALVICGTTGEASTLSEFEKKELYRHAVRFVNGRCKIIAGTGGNCTKSSAELSEAAGDAGADAVLCVTPYYNKCTQDGLLKHYEMIAERSPVPLIVYNVPSRTTVNITPQTCQRLSEHPNIIGIKEADPDVARVTKIRRLCASDFHIWCGNDDRIVPFYAAGAEGVISVYGNLYPEQLKELTTLCETGAYKKAAKIQEKILPVVEALFCEPNPIPVKAALRLLGFDAGDCRLPLTRLSEAPEAMLSNILTD